MEVLGDQFWLFWQGVWYHQMGTFQRDWSLTPQHSHWEIPWCHQTDAETFHASWYIYVHTYQSKCKIWQKRHLHCSKHKRGISTIQGPKEVCCHASYWRQSSADYRSWWKIQFCKVCWWMWNNLHCFQEPSHLQQGSLQSDMWKLPSWALCPWVCVHMHGVCIAQYVHPPSHGKPMLAKSQWDPSKFSSGWGINNTFYQTECWTEYWWGMRKVAVSWTQYKGATLKIYWNSPMHKAYEKYSV